MKHEQWKEWILLDLYGELRDKERNLLDRHLTACEECLKERDRAQRFHQQFHQHQSASIPQELLDDARRNLFEALPKYRAQTSVADKWSDFFARVFAPKPRLVYIGAVIASIVFLTGYFIGVQRRDTSVQNIPAFATTDSDDQSIRIANLQFAPSEINGDVLMDEREIEFTFDAVKQIHIKGKIGDERIQRMLARALLYEQNPGVRYRFVNTLASTMTIAHDDEIKNALRHAAMHDANPGVRMEAIKSLRKFPLDEALKKTFLFVLTHDSTSGLRIEAINALVREDHMGGIQDQEILRTLREKLFDDDNSYIRYKARTILQES